MVASNGRTSSSLAEAVFERGFEFEFFQAVRLLARLFPDQKAIGGTTRASDEFLRFRAWRSLAFPASAVDYVERAGNGDGQPVMTVTFMALTGIQGVLPIYYTEILLAAQASKNDAYAEFLDIFNHRLVSLFYRAWQKHHPPVLYETAALEEQAPDPFTHALYDLLGMGTSGLRGRLRIEDENLLLYAGLIAQKPHSATAIRGILRDYFCVPIDIEPLVGSWYELEDADRCYLSPDSESNQLGVGAFLGSKVWDQQARFRIRVGPVPMERFKQFLPNGIRLDEFKELTRFLVGHALAFDVQLLLCASDVPELRLLDTGENAPRLGWTSWLKTVEFQTDAGDAVFTYLN